MSKFRKNKTKNKMEVCGKVPVAPVYAGVKELVSGLPYGVREGSDEPCLKLIDDYYKFAQADGGEGQKFFFSVTKEHEPSSRFLETGSTNGWIVSVGMLRHMVEIFMPRILKSRYTDVHRGDKRKRDNKSMDWVKPDFFTMKYFMKTLDLIQFVLESPCEIIEASGSKQLFDNACCMPHYGYGNRGRQTFLNNAFLSKRYEATSWYNICRKCYYDEFDDSVWTSTTDYQTLRGLGMSYDTILSELAMTLK